jgi:aminoglycoside 6-adenylyltransferase
MLNLIINVANKDENIRVVMLSGSRACEYAPKDIYQDYDIVYFVSDIKPYYNNLEWINLNFGQPAIMQLPELMTHPKLPPCGDGHFTYLMIFDDGNRIDLSIEFTPYIDDGEPAIVLLDKDNGHGFIPHLSISQSYFNVKQPNEKLFHDTCNEFWWCLNNVAKGIARDELPYAMEMFNCHVRDMLNQMVSWYIGVITEFSVSSGKMGKYFKRYLPSELYDQYLKTYSDSNYINLWNSVFTACELFRYLALQVADYFTCTYNQQEDGNMTSYLKKVMDANLAERVKPEV